MFDRTINLVRYCVQLIYYASRRRSRRHRHHHHRRRRRRHRHHNHHHHHHHHHLSVMELDHLFTRSGLTYPEVSSKVCHNSFCQLGNSVSLHWVISYEASYLHVVSSFSCIPVICAELVLFLIPL